MSQSTERVDVAGFGIANDAAPADSFGRHVGKPDVVAILPNRLAGLGVQADHFLAFARSAGFGTLDRVQPTIHHDRGTGTTDVVSLPEQVAALTTFGIPVVGQVLSLRRCRQTLDRANRANRPTPVPWIRLQARQSARSSEQGDGTKIESHRNVSSWGSLDHMGMDGLVTSVPLTGSQRHSMRVISVSRNARRGIKIRRAKNQHRHLAHRPGAGHRGE